MHAMPDTYLLPDEASAYLRVAVQTLAKWRSLGKGPPYRKVAGGHIRYVQSELDDWMEAQAVVPGRPVDDLPLPPTPRAAVHALPPRRRASKAKY
jgi:predicted DNA-binding transcriptional regulator AlpA